MIVQGLHGDSDDEIVPETPPEPPDVSTALKMALDAGMSERDAVRQVSADLKLSRRDVYTAMLALQAADADSP